MITSSVGFTDYHGSRPMLLNVLSAHHSLQIH